MGTSKSRASRKKRQFTDDGKKILYKIAGFQAFSPNIKPATKKPTGHKRKTVAYEPVMEPETAIHSLAWATAIVPQESGFLRLPLELRMKIYEFAIRDFGCGRAAIEPRKKGMKFKSDLWSTSDEDTSRLYLICRQSYVDTVGRGILYSQKLFSFASPNTMLNYLWVIHPVHLSALTSIELNVNYSKALSLNSLPFEQLTKCESLERLYIQVEILVGLCHKIRHLPMPVTTHGYLATPYRRITEYSLPSRLWEKLTDWEMVRRLSDLDDFRFSIRMPCHSGIVSRCWTEADAELLCEIEEGIRKVVLKNSGVRELLPLEDALTGTYPSMVIKKLESSAASGFEEDNGVIDLT